MTPTPETKLEKQPIPEVKVPEVTPTPETKAEVTEVTETKELNLDKPDTGSSKQSQIQE